MEFIINMNINQPQATVAEKIKMFEKQAAVGMTQQAAGSTFKYLNYWMDAH